MFAFVDKAQTCGHNIVNNIVYRSTINNFDSGLKLNDITDGSVVLFAEGVCAVFLDFLYDDGLDKEDIALAVVIINGDSAAATTTRI